MHVAYRIDCAICILIQQIFVILLSCELGQSAQHHVDMPETGGLDRKRKVIAAHRGSVTRIVGQVYEFADALSVLRLRQQKSLLSGKLDVLSKLDDELIEMVAEDELDHKVEQADIIKETIGLCIMDIDETLERASSHVVTDPATTGDVSFRTTPSTKTLTQLTHILEGYLPHPLLLKWVVLPLCPLLLTRLAQC